MTELECFPSRARSSMSEECSMQMPPSPDDDEEERGRTARSACRPLRRKETAPRLRLRSSLRKRESNTGRDVTASGALALLEFRRYVKTIAPRMRRTPIALYTARRRSRYRPSSSAMGTSAGGVASAIYVRREYAALVASNLVHRKRLISPLGRYASSRMSVVLCSRRSY